MVRITCYLRPHRLEPVKSAVAALGVSGMSVSDVRGVGVSPERAEWPAGGDEIVAMPIRAKLEVVLPDELVAESVDAIVEAARTGEPDDGKLFVEPVLDAVRVRTQERGAAAL